MTVSNQTFKKIEELGMALQGVKRVIIMSHNNPDPDGISCSIALQKILKDRFKIKSIVRYNGLIARAENREMIRLLKIKISLLKQSEIRKTDSFALVDCQPNTGNSILPKGVDPLIVIDHHPQRKTTKAKFCDIRPDYGGTATILSEYMLASGTELTTQIATALCYGISSETQHLGRGATPVDASIYSSLFSTANKKILSQIENPILPKVYYKTLNRALHRASIYKHAIVANLGEISAPDFVPIVADLLLKCERISWSMVCGRFENKILISLRTSQKNANAGVLLRKIVGKRGTAGGHENLAGGQIYCEHTGDTYCDQIENDLRHKFLKRFGYKEGGDLTPLLVDEH